MAGQVTDMVLYKPPSAILPPGQKMMRDEPLTLPGINFVHESKSRKRQTEFPGENFQISLVVKFYMYCSSNIECSN